MVRKKLRARVAGEVGSLVPAAGLSMVEVNPTCNKGCRLRLRSSLGVGLQVRVRVEVGPLISAAGLLGEYLRQ